MHIHARDEIVINAPLAAVHAVLLDTARYAEWWPRTLKLTLLSPQRFRIQPYGGAGFVCEIVGAADDEITTRYSGLYSGQGSFRLQPECGDCRVIYTIDLATNAWWVKWLDRIINISAAHSRLMRQLLQNLRAVKFQ